MVQVFLFLKSFWWLSTLANCSHGEPWSWKLWDFGIDVLVSMQDWLCWCLWSVWTSSTHNFIPVTTSSMVQAIDVILHHAQTKPNFEKWEVELQCWSRRPHYQVLSPLAEVLHTARNSPHWRRGVSRSLVVVGAIAKWQFCLQVLLIRGESEIDQDLMISAS